MDNENPTKNRKWQITLTEEQLCVMITAMEDWHRFLCGQCSMNHATSYIGSPKDMRITRGLLDNCVKPAMFPELARDAAYSWDGGQSNPYMSRAAAISYLLYREPLHQLALVSDPRPCDVYMYDTPTCSEQGPMIKVGLLHDEDVRCIAGKSDVLERYAAARHNYDSVHPVNPAAAEVFRAEYCLLESLFSEEFFNQTNDNG